MKTFATLAALAAAVCATPSAVEDHVARAELAPRASATVTSKGSSSITPITVKGNAFFAGKERFYMRGVDYQPGGSSKLEDPIATEADCTRDIEYFKKLGINTVRIYTVDNTADHDTCMKLLADAGIYLVLDVNTPKYSLNRADPATSYNEVYLQNIFATIDIFAHYDNTLAFFSGNEVINDDLTTNTAPYIKAVTRDIKTYIASRGYRNILVGYSAADVESNRYETAEYMNCGTDDERSDFFAFNDYSWCDPSDFQTSGWDKKVALFKNYGIPLFLSEYGCNTNKREFNEVKSLYSTDMTAVYSGGLCYEYSQEENKYGLVEIDGSNVSLLDDFTTLMKAFKSTANPSGDGGYNATGGASGCPAKSDTWNVDGNDLPAMPTKAKAYLKNGAGKGAGLKGSGSQTAGTPSSGTAKQGSGTVDAAVSGTSDSASATSSSAALSSIQAPLSKAPFMISGAVLAFSVLGAVLL